MYHYWEILPPDGQRQSYPDGNIVDGDGKVDVEPHENTPVPG